METLQDSGARAPPPEPTVAEEAAPVEPMRTMAFLPMIGSPQPISPMGRQAPEPAPAETVVPAVAKDTEESTDAYADEPLADASAELQAAAAAAAPAPAGDVAALEVELPAEQGALAAAGSPV